MVETPVLLGLNARLKPWNVSAVRLMGQFYSNTLLKKIIVYESASRFKNASAQRRWPRLCKPLPERNGGVTVAAKRA